MTNNSLSKWNNLGEGEKCNLLFTARAGFSAMRKQSPKLPKASLACLCICQKCDNWSSNLAGRKGWALLAETSLQSRARGRHIPGKTMELVFVKNNCLTALGILPAQPWGILPKKKTNPRTKPHKNEVICNLFSWVSFGTELCAEMSVWFFTPISEQLSNWFLFLFFNRRFGSLSQHR